MIDHQQYEASHNPIIGGIDENREYREKCAIEANAMRIALEDIDGYFKTGNSIWLDEKLEAKPE